MFFYLPTSPPGHLFYVFFLLESEEGCFIFRFYFCYGEIFLEGDFHGPYL